MQRHILLLFVLTATLASAAEQSSAPAASESDAPRIGLRPPPDDKAAALAKVAALCRALAPAAQADNSARTAAMAALKADTNRSGELLLLCLDPDKVSDENVRLGALAGIEALKPAEAPYSARLAETAIYDPAESVRKAAVALIKTRGDDPAIASMVQSLLSAYDEGGQVKSEYLRNNAVSALKDLNDTRVYRALLYYVTMELRVASTSLNNMVTRTIDTFTINHGANVDILTLLRFPIQFPEISITRVKTTVVAPAAALSDLSGQNFGNDVDKWAKWVQKQ